MVLGFGAKESERDAELKRLEALPGEEKKRRMDEANWLLPPTGCFYLTKDVTQLEGAASTTAKLHVRHCLPKDHSAIRATIFYLHGLHAHVSSKPIAKLYELLVAENIAVVAIDLPGHGYSEGEPMFLPSLQPVFEVLEGFIELVMGHSESERKQEAERELGIPQAALAQLRAKPFFTMGDSLGGLIATHVSMRIHNSDAKVQSGFRGAILCNPALAVNVPPAPVRWLMQRVVAKNAPYRCMPSFVSSTAALKPEDLFKDPEHQEMAIFDNRPVPERGLEGTPGALSWRHGIRWATAGAVLDVIQDLENTLHEVTFPFLILHAPEDAVTTFNGSEHMMAVCRSTDKTLMPLPGGLHVLVLNVPEKVVAEASAWMAERL